MLLFDVCCFVSRYKRVSRDGKGEASGVFVFGSRPNKGKLIYAL